MLHQREQVDGKPRRVVKMSRLEALGDAVFAFALTLLALDLRLPEITPDALGQGILALLPKLLVFVFAFLVIAQEWDVHQRTMLHIARADGVFVWLYLFSLMFVVLMPASADILGRYPLQPLALVFFGINIAFLCLASWLMWQYASHRGQLLDADLDPHVARLIARLWIFPPLVIAVTMPLGFFNVFPVYGIWVLMPIFSYTYSIWAFRGRRKVPAEL
jgi:uncharacterized membrane protein